MPELKLTKKFLKDLENLRKKDKKKLRQVIKSMALLEQNPLHPGLHIERIVNDPSAWSARVDRRLRISFEPQEYLPSGNPDWTKSIILLRILDHDDLYKEPR
jgi:mRNA-degrading endonuclease YafQ of YafQ-DinJ toxin-antitoxin module